MKKHISVSKFFLLFITLSYFSLLACEGRENVSSKKTEVAREIDQLFEDLGVLRVSIDTEPIEIRLKDVKGREIALSDFRGRILFLNFWATWCPPCREEMPSMEKLYQRFKDREFAMVAVSLQEPALRVEKFFREHNLSFIALLDSTGDVGSQLGIRSIPTTFILNRSGKVIGGVIGTRKWDSRKSFALFDYLIEKGAEPPL
jgi:peroxiredoxin